MATRMRDVVMGGLADLRFEPTERRVRAFAGEALVADTPAGTLVWEPRRVVPSFAVPEADIRAELVRSSAPPPAADAPVLHPRIPFAVHSSPGVSLDVHVGDGDVREAAAFRPDDPALAGLVVLDHFAFDSWLEEDEPLIGHPRDPFHRVDIRESSRTVRVSLDGQVLAETSEPMLVFETNLPLRFYLPKQSLRVELEPGTRRTTCAYKGHATYWSVEGADNVAWSYESPLRDALALTGRVAFHDELVDVTVDGMPRERPSGPMAAALIDESRRA